MYVFNVDLKDIVGSTNRLWWFKIIDVNADNIIDLNGNELNDSLIKNKTRER